MSFRKILIAIFAASGAPAIIMAVLGIFVGVFLKSTRLEVQSFSSVLGNTLIAIPVFIVALLHALLLGIPAYLLVKRMGLFCWQSSLLAGFIIGFLPVSVLTFVQTDKFNFSGGWIIFGACGMLGGYAAYRTLRLPMPLSEKDDTGLNALRKKLIEGEASGIANSFSFNLLNQKLNKSTRHSIEDE